VSGNRPIHRLVIVNRGEAATRCVRTVKSLRARERSDMEVVALYTEPDRLAPFVRLADRAVHLPSPSGAVAAYLDREGLVAAVRSVEGDAVWPGWGFVAEDPVFAEALAEAGIRFLGPSPSAMRALGDKITSKELAERAGVPVTDWSGGALADEAEAAAHAERIGFPLVLKASAGGGGRGIRVVQDPAGLAEAFRSARSEAESAFGDGRLFAERFVAGGRHIEVQVAADLHGHARSFGCRDCSVQRRHQKVIEEAPPPGLAPALLGRLEDAAVRMVQEVGYSGVGTVEFLLSGEEFYFLEVNPRLQVEHGITEEVAGIDLVEIQIRIARGESIAGIETEDRGVAIEVRVCAEDPDAGFLPSPGVVGRFEPALGPRIRIDSGVALGTPVPPDFDSLVCKVIASGETRYDAMARLSASLRDFELLVEKGATNKGYLLELLEAPELVEGGVDTRWLDRYNESRAERAATAPAEARDTLVAAAILSYQRTRGSLRYAFYSDPTNISEQRVGTSEGQQVDLSFGGEPYRMMVYAIGSWRYRVHLDGRTVTATLREETPATAQLVIDGRQRRVVYDWSQLGVRLEVDGQPYRFGQAAGQVRAGTPAMVVSLAVAEGDSVELGQPLGLVEAMKMEIGFTAPVAGVVQEVRVRVGQQVAAGDVLLVIDPAADQGEARIGRRLELPDQEDPLARLFEAEGDEPLARPDLAAADALDREERRATIATLREELRRVLLGYDINAERGDSLVAFLEAPLPEGLSKELRLDLGSVAEDLPAFADTQELFIRSPRASVSGELGPSNEARLRMYVRRMQAEGAGMAEEFLELVRNALGHYGVATLEPSDRLERAVMRLLALKVSPELRNQLVTALITRISAIALSGVDLRKTPGLADALERIARMRGLLPDAMADAAIEASYVAFERPALERRAEQTSEEVEDWLRKAEQETAPSLPPRDVLVEFAAAPRAVFARVSRWIAAEDANRREIALATLVQRRYAPQVPSDQRSLQIAGTRIHCAEYGERGLVLAATAGEKEVALIAERLCETARQLTEKGDAPLYAIDLVVPSERTLPDDEISEALAQVLEQIRLPVRFSLALQGEPGSGDSTYRTFEPAEDGVLRPAPGYYDLHPETADRIDLARLRNFDLERIPSEDGIYSFYGRSREVRGDERVFVLADAMDRAPLAPREVVYHLAAFERVFHRAARSLRSILRVRDPQRSLQWNRIVVCVAPEIHLDRETAGAVARRLAPATRHLGLEKVIVRLNLIDREAGGTSQIEVVIREPAGEQMEIAWRPPHREPLEPAQDYERRVVAARQRRLVYPYEIVRMLTAEGDDAAGFADEGEGLPKGSFVEYDLAEGRELRAEPVEREHGRNRSNVVFGVISTPTDKVPEGVRRVLVLSDPTMGMGALAGPECDRLVAAIDLAEREGLPVEWVPISSGARIAMDSGTENLDATARVVRRIVTFTQAGGVIHVIVQGVNVGAQSYFDALATMLTHTRGVLIMTPRASMVLTGRAALEASGAVAAEDEVAIGGFERIMGPNGQGQYYARNLFEAYRILYDHYRYTYVAGGERRPRRLDTRDDPERSLTEHPMGGEDDAFGFATVGEIFDDTTNPGRKRPFPMRAVMRALVDQDGGHLERWHQLIGGETAIVWDAHLGGHPVCLIGIESHSVPREGYRPLDGPESWTGGTLFPLSSKKVARALNAASDNRPAVILANLSGFDGSPESLRRLQLEYGAEIARAVVNFEGPLLFMVVSRYHGGAYVVFSQELNPQLSASALTGSFASVIGGGPAAKVVFARDVHRRVLADPRVAELERAVRWRPSQEARDRLDALIADVTLEKQAELAAEFDAIHTVERAREVGSLDAIVEPEHMRAHLIASLDRALGD